MNASSRCSEARCRVADHRCRAWECSSRRRRPGRRCGGRVPTGDAFYVPPKPLAKAKPGTIIRSTPIAAPAGARAWKILYHSRAVDGQRHRRLRGGGRPHRPSAAWRTGGGHLGTRRRRPRRHLRTLEAARHRVRRVRRSHWLPARAHPDAADLPRRGLCRRGHRLRGTRHARLAPIARGRERGAGCARRGPRRTRPEGRRRRQQGARVRALPGRPLGVVRRRARGVVRAGAARARHRGRGARGQPSNNPCRSSAAFSGPTASS